MAKFYRYDGRFYTGFFEAENEQEALERVYDVFRRNGEEKQIGEPHTLRDCEIDPKDYAGFREMIHRK